MAWDNVAAAQGRLLPGRVAGSEDGEVVALSCRVAGVVVVGAGKVGRGNEGIDSTGLVEGRVDPSRW